MMIDALRVAEEKYKKQAIADWRKGARSTKDRGPYWIKMGPKTPLEGLEIEYAKLMGFEPWDVWRDAVYALVKGSRADRREFLGAWLCDLDHAGAVSGKALDNTAIYLPVWV